MRFIKHLLRHFLINGSASGSFPRSSGLKEDDIILASYPKSGNTWMRMILAHLLYPGRYPDSLSALNWLVPDIYWGIPRWMSYSTPRVVKTHQPFGFRHEGNNHSLYQKNLYIVRHPLDVALSLFDFQFHLWPNPEKSFEIFVKKFVQGALPGNSSWQEHVLSWKAIEHERTILFMRYEDLLKSPLKGIIDLARFLGRHVTPKDCQEIVGRTSLDNMIKMEARGSIVEGTYNFIGRKRRLARNDVTAESRSLIMEHSAIAMDLFDYIME